MKNTIFGTLATLMFLSFTACGDKLRDAENEAGLDFLTSENENMETLFVGTYTKKEGHVDGQANGILSLYRNPETGTLHKGKTVAEIINPSFVKVSEDGNFLYAVSELGENDAESGFIYSFRINENDSLEHVSKLSTENFAPAHIETDQTGKYVFVSNYMGGVVMMYRVGEDGDLQTQQRIDLENPQESHAHSVTISDDNKHAYIADLGNDKIWIYDLNADEGQLAANPQPFVALEEGAGPRHFTISKKDNFAYSINELNSSISVFRILPGGGLEIIQNISSLPKAFSGDNSAADIHLHPSEEFLYVSNRGHNSIAAFGVERITGQLVPLQFISTQGKTPRNFAISEDGKFLYAANQDSNSVTTFKIEEKTGRLEPLDEPLEVMTPVSLEFYK
ncbi:lactonase family protein [Salinimicrobium sp. GXAS 041]|uniref:lactonase family protein n=1 Tax=Salinimicrobium sp. GXAS 041 TaxID=3400806 RepID=UPI003C792B9D